MELLAGAMDMFKNPTSHQDVQLDDPMEAADLLMRVLDRIEDPLPWLGSRSDHTAA